MAALADRQLVAVGELSEWSEDVADGAEQAIVLLEVPRGWGRSTVLDWLAEKAKPEAGDPVTFLFRIPGSELAEERGSQANEICGFLADAAAQHPVARALGLDRLAGVAVLGLGVGSCTPIQLGCSVTALATVPLGQAESRLLVAHKGTGFSVWSVRSGVPGGLRRSGYQP